MVLAAGCRQNPGRTQRGDARQVAIEAAPELLLGFGGHGRLRSLPCSISSSTLASNGSSLPAARSCCIWVSQVSSSHSCRQRATSARSSKVSREMAALISATVLMLPGIHPPAAPGKLGRGPTGRRAVGVRAGARWRLPSGQKVIWFSRSGGGYECRPLIGLP